MQPALYLQLPNAGHANWSSVLILLLSIPLLLYFLYAFIHARLMSADMHELDRLFEQGALCSSGNLETDIQALCDHLAAIAPGVYVRQEVWIRLYFQLLRFMRLVSRWRAGIDREMWRIAAYQAAQYRLARQKLSDLHS